MVKNLNKAIIYIYIYIYTFFFYLTESPLYSTEYKIHACIQIHIHTTMHTDACTYTLSYRKPVIGFFLKKP